MSIFSNKSRESEVKTSTIRIIYPFGPKIFGCNEFKPEWDTTDQRSPVQDPGELYDQYLRPDYMEEMEKESVEDFDDDIAQYDYEDISEYGADVVFMNQPENAGVSKRMAKRSKARR